MPHWCSSKQLVEAVCASECRGELWHLCDDDALSLQQQLLHMVFWPTVKGLGFSLVDSCCCCPLSIQTSAIAIDNKHKSYCWVLRNHILAMDQMYTWQCTFFFHTVTDNRYGNSGCLVCRTLKFWAFSGHHYWKRGALQFSNSCRTYCFVEVCHKAFAFIDMYSEDFIVMSLT